MKARYVPWKKLLLRITIWLAIEISFTFLGIDDLADYVEFVDDRNFLMTMTIAQI
jgi:hypothetical protein